MPGCTLPPAAAPRCILLPVAPPPAQPRGTALPATRPQPDLRPLRPCCLGVCAARQEADAARRAALEADAWLDAIPAAPVYTPTADEWADPLAYIGRIQAEAAQWGICVVRAPVAPSTPGGMVRASWRGGGGEEGRAGCAAAVGCLCGCRRCSVCCCSCCFAD